MKKIILVLPLLITACSSMHNSKIGADIQPQVKTDVTATINMGQKVSGMANCTEFLFMQFTPEKQTYIPEMAAKLGNLANDECTAGAVYNAVSANNGDILVAPQYTTIKNGILCFPKLGCLFGNTKVLVSGYIGKITSVK